MAMHPNLVQREGIDLLAEAGCAVVWLGVEVGNQDFRVNVLRKRSTNDDVVAAVREVRRAGIEVAAWFMWDLPGESLEQAHETIDFIRELDLDCVGWSPSGRCPPPHSAT